MMDGAGHTQQQKHTLTCKKQQDPNQGLTGYMSQKKYSKTALTGQSTQVELQQTIK